MSDTYDAANEDPLLKEIRDRFQYASEQWQEIRDEANEDMKFVGGDPWTDADKAQRKDRPTVAPDELHQYFNQVINGLRANPRGIKYSPTGNGANDEGARFYENKFREIEYRSHAQLSYVTAAENAIQQSFGWCRLNTRYENDRSDNQDLWIEDIPNPHMVLPDPDAKRPDSSDMKYLFFFEERPIEEFKREYPDAKITDFHDYQTIAPQWIQEQKLVLAEYWKIKTTKRELLTFSDGSTTYSDELKTMPTGLTVARKRDVDVPSVCQYLTNGIEILKTTEWPGKYIPFASCFGKVIYVRGKRKILSMTRAGREPWKLYCYYRSQQAEMAGMIPKVPVQAYEGQMSGWESEWQKAAHEPVSFLYFKGKTQATGEAILPPPARLDYHAGEHLQSLELCAEGARRSIQAAMSVGFLPTAAQRRNEKSGVALKHIDESAQRGSFHFDDHYNDMIRQIGIMAEDLMDKIYDTARDVGIRKTDESAEIVRINDPQAKTPDGKPSVSTKGQYLGTVSTGQSFDSEREAASDFADLLAQNPQIFPLVASEVVKLKNLGPIGDAIAENLEILKPPELRKQKDGQPPLPPEVQQALAKGQQENQALKAALGELNRKVETKQVETQSKEKITAAELHSKERLEVLLQTMKDATAIAVKKLDLLGKGVIAGRESEAEHIALGAQHAHEAVQADMDRQHEAELAERAQQHAVAMGAAGAAADANNAERSHVQALEIGDRGHEQSLEAAEQAAALAPQPEAGA